MNMLDLDDPKFDCFENRSILEDQLIPLIRRNRIIPFVGAGLSIDIYSSWGVALRKMMKGHFNGRESEADEVESLINCGDFEAAAQKIHDVLCNTIFYDRLVAMFKDSFIRDESLKKMSVRYLPRLFKNSLVITTNFDKVLERAFLMEQHSFEEKLVLRHLTPWQALRVQRGSSHYLIKIHGCVSAPDEVVMTKDSYNDLYQEDSEHIKRLHSILSGNNLLFIGCGLKEDRTVDLLTGLSTGGHYAILPMDGEAGEEAFEERRAFIADRLQMHCIWYPNGEYHYVEDILEYIYADITGQVKEVESIAPEFPHAYRKSSPTQAKKSAEVTRSDEKPLVRNEIYTMGRWKNKLLEWHILDVQPDRALLITKDCLMTAPYNKKLESVTWAKCSLKKELLPQLLEQIFDDKERSRVLTWDNKNPDNEMWRTRGSIDTKDNLFLLSINEVKQYFPYDKARVARLEGKAVWWWLRSPGCSPDNAAHVSPNGGVHDIGDSVSFSGGGVRPAFWLNLKS